MVASMRPGLHPSRSQLKLKVQFSAAELERELVLGLGDAGLLAELHAEILKGISPKSGGAGEARGAAWQSAVDTSRSRGLLLANTLPAAPPRPSPPRPDPDVAPSNWQVHLGNKLRYHWKTTLAGGECPFKARRGLRCSACRFIERHPSPTLLWTPPCCTA